MKKKQDHLMRSNNFWSNVLPLGVIKVTFSGLYSKMFWPFFIYLIKKSIHDTHEANELTLSIWPTRGLNMIYGSSNNDLFWIMIWNMIQMPFFDSLATKTHIQTLYPWSKTLHWKNLTFQRSKCDLLEVRFMNCTIINQFLS